MIPINQINDIAITALPAVLRPETLMPGHQSLAEEAEARCGALHAAGILRASDLLAAAVDAGLPALARRTHVPAAWVETLCRLVEHHRYRPVTLAKVPALPPSLQKPLAARQIRRSDALFELLRTPAQRRRIASEAGVEPACIEECAAMLDLTRKPGIKAVKARLFLAAGIRSLHDLGDRKPGELRAGLEALILAERLPRAVPTPKEVLSDVAWARIYPVIMEL